MSGKMRQTVSELQERIKELQCLYAVSSLVQRRDLVMDDILREVAEALRQGYRHPELARVRVTVSGQVQYPPGDTFHETPWRQASALVLDDQTAGTLEVFYEKYPSSAGDGPFLDEEQALLDGVARILGNYLYTQREQAARQNSEVSAHLREQEFRSLAENSPDIIARFDREFRHIYINPVIERFTGRPWQSFLGRTNADLGMPDHLVEMWHAKLGSVFETGQEQRLEFKFPSPTGETFFENILIPEQGPGGDVETVLCVVHEQTDHVHAEKRLMELKVAVETKNEELAHANSHLEAVNAELERFTSVVSHDLKAPLRAIHGLSCLVEEDEECLSEQGRSRLRSLREKVCYMDDLIDALLDYSRTGGEQRRIEEVDVAQLVRSVAAALDVPEGFTVFTAEGLPRLHTDRPHLQQVFANLIGNAVEHHGGRDGHVWISARDVGGFFEFAVADDGSGIPREHQERIFDIFHRVDTFRGRGSGIGLAVVKKIVENIGGEIDVESEPGAGTTFRFTWPKRCCG